MRWRMFGADGQEKFEDKPVVERFKTELPYSDSLFTFEPCKCLVKVDCLLQAQCHLHMLLPRYRIVNDRGEQAGLKNIPPMGESKIWVNHYFTKSYEEWLWKMARGSAHTFAGTQLGTFRDYGMFFEWNPDLRRLFNKKYEGEIMRPGHGRNKITEDLVDPS